MKKLRLPVIILAAIVSFVVCYDVLHLVNQDSVSFTPRYNDLTNERIPAGTVIPLESLLTIGPKDVQLTSIAHSCSCLSVSSPLVDFEKLPVLLRANSRIPIRVEFDTTSKAGIVEQGVTFSFEVGEDASFVRHSLAVMANIRAPMQPCPPHVVLNSLDSTVLVRICDEDAEPLYAVESISYELPVTAKVVAPSPMHINFSGRRFNVRSNIEIGLEPNVAKENSTEIEVKLHPLDDRLEPETILIPVRINSLRTMRSSPSKLYASISGKLVKRDIAVIGPLRVANCKVVSCPDFCNIRLIQELDREAERMYRFEVTGSIGSGEIVFQIGEENLVVPVKFL